MKRFYLLIVGIAVVSLAVSGCVSISKYTPPSSEEEKPLVKSQIGKAEPKIKVDVELLERPDLSRFSAPKTPDSEITGNAGNFEGGRLMFGQASRQDIKERSDKQPKVWWPAPQITQIEAPQAMQVREEQLAYTTYKVKKGQTLQDISKEVYGTTKKWKKIYNVNKDKIKNPDKIYAGQVLNIPQEGIKQHLK
jgi:nucleoid-associated protein YgaU